MGIEPTTLSLQGRNAEALEHASPYVFVRVTGIEPTSPTWKAGVITIIRYPRVSLFVGKVGFEPTFSTSRYVYSVYKTPTVLAEIKKPSPFETGF